MSSFDDALSPVGWTEFKTSDGNVLSGIWTKAIRTPEAEAQTFHLIRYEPGASGPPYILERSQQVLILHGSLEERATDPEGGESESTYHRGAFVNYPRGTRCTRTSPQGCVLLLTAERPERAIDVSTATPEAVRIERLRDCFGPGGWNLTPNVGSTPGPEMVEGVWTKQLHSGGSGHNLLLVYFEPGAVYPRHVHTEPEQLFIVEGEAEDEIYEEGGTVQNVTYRPGAFVDYPVPLHHSTHCPRGCLLAFGM